MVNLLLRGIRFISGETQKELVWEEKAPASVARNAYDGVEVLDGKIYFVGGWMVPPKILLKDMIH